MVTWWFLPTVRVSFDIDRGWGKVKEGGKGKGKEDDNRQGAMVEMERIYRERS